MNAVHAYIEEDLFALFFYFYLHLLFDLIDDFFDTAGVDPSV